LPNRRYLDRARVRARLGYDERRVVLCSVGGTAVGDPLLRLCAAGYRRMKEQHLAACDVAVVQSGGTTTLELTAVRRPFVYFPLEGHFEQTLIAEQLSRHQAGERLEYSETTPETLADTVLRLLDTEPSWPPIPTDGARRAAALIDKLLDGNSEPPVPAGHVATEQTSAV
jgi:UDP:flavonoid glycosyltransferase YjiC (YdhE family)